MSLRGFFIDASLLVLLVVGSTGRDIIGKHRRLREYSVEDYETLLKLVGRVDRVLVTPNTLTEASNLLDYHADPERSRFFHVLRRIIHESEEVVVVSEVAASNREFPRLGLADAVLLEAITPETPVVTVDLDLYLAALNKGQDTALNFRHLRDPQLAG